MGGGVVVLLGGRGGVVRLLVRLLVLVVEGMALHVNVLALLLLLLQSRRCLCSHVGGPLPAVAAAHAAPQGDEDEGNEADGPHLRDG